MEYGLERPSDEWILFSLSQVKNKEMPSGVAPCKNYDTLLELFKTSSLERTLLFAAPRHFFRAKSYFASTLVVLRRGVLSVLIKIFNTITRRDEIKRFSK